jgi:hypothetical protein
MVDMNKLMVALLETMQGATAEINKLNRENQVQGDTINVAQLAIDKNQALISEDTKILESAKTYYKQVFGKEPEF